MALSLEVSHPLLVLVRLVPTVAFPPITHLFQAHPVTTVPQMNMALVLGITRSTPPRASLEALLAVLKVSRLAKREETIS